MKKITKLKLFFLGYLDEKRVTKLFKKIKQKYPNAEILKVDRKEIPAVFKVKRGVKMGGLMAAISVLLFFLPGTQPVAITFGMGTPAYLTSQYMVEYESAVRILKDHEKYGDVLGIRLEADDSGNLKYMYILYNPIK